VQRSDFRRKKLIEEYAILPISHGDGQTIEQSCKVLICHFEHTVPSAQFMLAVQQPAPAD
jgi:hypothetical protein